MRGSIFAITGKRSLYPLSDFSLLERSGYRLYVSFFLYMYMHIYIKFFTLHVFALNQKLHNR